MDNAYLQELISEAQNRGGGLLLNFNEKPAVVVLTVEKYNQMMETRSGADLITAAEQRGSSPQAVPAELFGNEENGPKKVLVTGGAGYIGAHVARVLLKAGHEVTILDNLCTGKRENVPAGARFVEGDLADVNLLRDLFAAGQFNAVVHMAASLEVEESTRMPERYFENNVINTSKLLAVMSEVGVKNLIFSSTAAVYGEPDEIPITEKTKARPNNPYGYTKLLAEKIIKYHCNFAGLRAVAFRYFNACGCDFDGLIKPTHASHLIPVVLGVAKGDRPCLVVNGDDYPTADGTCVRDYVHVLDIANAHAKALSFMQAGENFRVINIGTGRGQSVREVVNGASEILNKIIPMEIGPRRAGDAAVTVADNAKLRQELGYELQYSDLNTIITTTWKQLTANE